MAKSSLKTSVRKAMQEARVERRRQAFSAILEGDIDLAAEFCDAATVDAMCADAEEYIRLVKVLSRGEDLAVLKEKRDAAKAEHLAAVAAEQQHFVEMKAKLGGLIAAHRGLAEQISSTERDQRRLAEMRAVYGIRA
jgi:hypothetical protein